MTDLAGAVQVRAATLADLPAVAALQVTGFAAVFGPALGHRPADEQAAVLLGLRRCRPEPATGLVVAVVDGRIVGVTEWRTLICGARHW
jgi:hypothetical protein